VLVPGVCVYIYGSEGLPSTAGTSSLSVRGRLARAARKPRGETAVMRSESPDSSYLVLPDGPGPFPGVVVIHDASGLNDNIRGICRRFAAEGHAAQGGGPVRGPEPGGVHGADVRGRDGREPRLLRRSCPEGPARAARPVAGISQTGSWSTRDDGDNVG
jgi:hypothetical protein